MTSAFGIKIESSFRSFTESEWNQLIREDYIFADHRFLTSLEESGSIGERSGWLPAVVSLRSSEGELAGALLLFQKTNSYGEYIFDWAWANAFHSARIPYYPKLTSAVPFVPATGPKFLIHPQAPFEETRQKLLEVALSLVSPGSPTFGSLHFLFLSLNEAEAFKRNENLLLRHSYQYHWRNRNYRDIDAFLGALKRKRRNEIRRERQGAQQLGLNFQRLTGTALTPDHARAMSRFYESTVMKMGGIPYLTPQFFDLVFSRMSENILLCLAIGPSQEMVAGALNFFSGRTLFGRHWGTDVELKYLHFELCYYQAIEWGIENGIELFEAGAQGEHKLSRGFLPSLTYSAHWVKHPEFRAAIARFIAEEKTQIRMLFDELNEHGPYQEAPQGEPEKPAAEKTANKILTTKLSESSQ